VSLDQGLDIAPQHALGAGAYSIGNARDLLKGSNYLWVRSAADATQVGRKIALLRRLGVPKALRPLARLTAR
jgi:hypothetical protein